MHLRALLQSYAPLPWQAPPVLEEADASPEEVRAVLDRLLTLARRETGQEASFGLLASNVIVEVDEGGEPDLIAPGRYVALTLQGTGQWTSDWRWVPGTPPPAPGVPVEVLASAGVCFAYGRALGESSAVTVFFRVLPPRPV